MVDYLAVFAVVRNGVGLAAIVAGEQVGVTAGDLRGQIVELQ